MPKRSRWYDLVVIALIAAISIVVKPYLRAPFSFVQTTFGMPIGTFIGGLYMFWPLLAGYMVPWRGAILLTCVLQGLLAIVTGFVGVLGPLAFFSYITPGLVIEALFLIPGAGMRAVPGGPRSGLIALLWAIAAAALGNMAGATTNALLFFSLKGSAFTLAVAASLITGGLGGWLAHVVGRRLGVAYRREAIASPREGLAGTGHR